MICTAICPGAGNLAEPSARSPLLRNLSRGLLAAVLSCMSFAATAQDTFNNFLEDLEVAMGALREELHVFADKRGDMVGNITIVDTGDEIDCRRMGSGGYSLPSIVEPDVIQFKKC